MKRRQFLGLAGAVGAAATVGACGVPGSSDPKYLGAAPTAGPQLPGPVEPLKPSAATTPRELASYFFKAAAGANYAGADKPDALKQAQERVREFLTDSAGKSWTPGKDLTVVRITLGKTEQTGGGTFTIAATLIPLGVLNDKGGIEPNQGQPIQFTFAVVQIGTEFRLDTAPPNLYLSDEGLREFYTPRRIYFWEQADNPTLVPDQRYLPKSVSDLKQPGEIIRWLTLGPSKWLQPVLQPPLADIELKDTSFAAGDRLVVNLSSKAATLDDDTQRRLAVQLRWSANLVGGVELRIEGKPVRASADDYLSANGAVRDGNSEPERFCLINQKVQAVDATNPATSILDTSLNSEIVVAAISRSKRNAALVRREPKNQQRLFLGSFSGTGDTKTPVYAQTNLVGQRLSRPVWITHPSPQVLVAGDGRLYAVPAPAAGSSAPIKAASVGLPKDLPSPITALSVSPEGHRIALIAGGQVIVAALIFGDALGITDFRIIKTDLGDQRAVGWSDETKLIVGGLPIPGTKSTLVEVAIDGAGQESVPNSTDAADGLVVGLLAVRPASPNPNGNAKLIMFDANGAAYRVYGQQVGPLAVVGAQGSPSPSGAAVSPPPTAPFFLD